MNVLITYKDLTKEVIREVKRVQTDGIKIYIYYLEDGSIETRDGRQIISQNAI